MNFVKNVPGQQRYLAPTSNNRNNGSIKSKSPINSKEIVYSEKLGRNEVQELRKKVQEINYNMNKRKRAIVKIQKVWRGYITRKKIRKLKGKLIKDKQERVKIQKKKDTIRRNAPKIICNAIYNYVLKKRNKEKDLLRKYLHHCATLIQKTFKGYNTRIKYYRTRRQMKHFQRLLLSVMKGWKTRKIMKHETIINFQQDIKDIENLQLELAQNDDPDAESIKEEIPFRLSRKKRQFIDNFYRLYFSGSWAQPANRYGGGGSRSQRNPPQQRGYDDRERENEYRPRRRQDSNEASGYPRERRSNRGYERTASIEAHENEGGVLEERGFDAGEHRGSIRGRRDVMPEEEFEQDVGRYESQERRDRERNAWEARDELPITGKGAYNLQDLPEEQPGDYQPRVQKGAKGAKGKRGGGKKKGPNAFDIKEEMPVGGKGAYVIPDDEGQPNAYNEKDEMPITGKGQYVLPDDMEGATPGGSEGQSKAKPKRQIAKKAKYDPRKAIEDAKKKEEEGVEEDKQAGNKKSEDFRNMLKNARKYQQEEKGGGGQEEKENISRSNNKPEKKGPVRGRAKGRKGVQEETEVAEEGGDSTPMNQNEEKEQKDDGGPKTFKFLKRKTKAMANQKLDWNKVSSRINCWVDKTQEGTEKSPEHSERPSTSKGKQQQQTLTAAAHVNPNALGKPGVKKGQNPKAATQKFGRLEKQEENAAVNRKGMKGNEMRREGYGQQKRQVSPPKQQQQQQRQAVSHHVIKLEELEKAYNTNFLNKLNHITQKFYSESGARDPEEPYESIVPILRLNSTFFFREDMDHYFDILADLDEEYQSLQIIN